MSALAPTSQLLLRQADALRDRDLLLINPPGDALVRQLERLGGHGVVFDQRRSAHLSRGLDNTESGFEARFGALYEGEQHPDVVLFAPREKARLTLLLEMAAAAAGVDGRVWLVGENRGGARSAGRHLDAVADRWDKADAARHCTLYRAHELLPAKAPRLADHALRWELRLVDQDLVLVSLPGVFSHGALDPATRMLVEHLPELSGEVLDFGCGCGVIALVAARRSAVSGVTVVDDDAVALEATRMTFAANGIRPPAVIAVSGVAEIDGPYAAILSNPPFHQGVATDYRVAEALIDEAPQHLIPGGQLVIVANAFLDYGRRIDERFGHCDVLAADRRFRVYRGRRRSSAGRNVKGG